MNKHIPTPWTVGFACRIVTDKGNSVALTSGEASSFPAEVNEANAEFIVRACNSHEALIEALRNLSEHYKVSGNAVNSGTLEECLEAARAALKQAEVSL